MPHVGTPGRALQSDPVGKDATSVIPGWLPVVLMGLFLLAVARQGFGAISDPDAFWHLRLGQDILDARSVSSVTESWSSLSSQPWVPTQWLTEVVLAVAEDTGGLPAVAWVFTVALLALALLVHRTARHAADAVPAAFTTGLTILAMSASLSPRPHMATYLLLCVTVLAWLRTIDDLRPRWWLVPVTWVWAMSHGMWFVGPLVGIVAIGGLLLDRRMDRRGVLKLAAVPVGSVVVAALTPVGPALLQAPFAVAGVGAFITEWQPPSFREPGPAVAALMVAAVVVSWSRSTRRVPWVEVALLLFSAAWIILATRTVALGAVVVSPLVAAALQGALRREVTAPTRAELRTLAGIAAGIAAVALFVVPTTASQPGNVPSGLNGDLDALPAGSVVYNDYKIGGWLRWRHPDLEPVVDGMTEAYSVQHLQEFGRVQALARDWEDTFDDWGPSAALVLDGSPVAAALEEQRGWRPLASDDGYVLLVPEGSP